MAETDLSKFNLGYLFTGAGAKDWFKALGNGWRLVVIIGVVFLLALGIKAIFSKNQTQKTQIRDVKGNVNIIQKSSRFLIPFVEVYTMKERKDTFDYGIKAGVRFEFN